MTAVKPPTLADALGAMQGLRDAVGESRPLAEFARAERRAHDEVVLQWNANLLPGPAHAENAKVIGQFLKLANLTLEDLDVARRQLVAQTRSGLGNLSLQASASAVKEALISETLKMHMLAELPALEREPAAALIEAWNKACENHSVETVVEVLKTARNLAKARGLSCKFVHALEGIRLRFVDDLKGRGANRYSARTQESFGFGMDFSPNLMLGLGVAAALVRVGRRQIMSLQSMVLGRATEFDGHETQHARLKPGLRSVEAHTTRHKTFSGEKVATDTYDKRLTFDEPIAYAWSARAAAHRGRHDAEARGDLLFSVQAGHELSARAAALAKDGVKAIDAGATVSRGKVEIEQDVRVRKLTLKLGDGRSLTALAPVAELDNIGGADAARALMRQYLEQNANDLDTAQKMFADMWDKIENHRAQEATPAGMQVNDPTQPVDPHILDRLLEDANAIFRLLGRGHLAQPKPARRTPAPGSPLARLIGEHPILRNDLRQGATQALAKAEHHLGVRAAADDTSHQHIFALFEAVTGKLIDAGISPDEASLLAGRVIAAAAGRDSIHGLDAERFGRGMRVAYLANIPPERRMVACEMVAYGLVAQAENPVPPHRMLADLARGLDENDIPLSEAQRIVFFEAANVARERAADSLARLPGPLTDTQVRDEVRKAASEVLGPGASRHRVDELANAVLVNAAQGGKPPAKITPARRAELNKRGKWGPVTIAALRNEPNAPLGSVQVARSMSPRQRRALLHYMTEHPDREVNVAPLPDNGIHVLAVQHEDAKGWRWSVFALRPNGDLESAYVEQFDARGASVDPTPRPRNNHEMKPATRRIFEPNYAEKRWLEALDSKPATNAKEVTAPRELSRAIGDVEVLTPPTLQSEGVYLGDGFFSEVYEMELQSLGDKIIKAAVKIYKRPEGSNYEDSNYDVENYESFLKEVRTARLMSEQGRGPRFYGIVDFGDGRLAFAMEKLDGLPIEKARHYITDNTVHEVAEQIEWMHAHGMCANDLQYVVTPDGHAKFFDFGMASYYDPHEITTIDRLYQLEKLRLQELGGSDAIRFADLESYSDSNPYRSLALGRLRQEERAALLCWMKEHAQQRVTVVKDGDHVQIVVDAEPHTGEEDPGSLGWSWSRFELRADGTFGPATTERFDTRGARLP